MALLGCDEKKSDDKGEKKSDKDDEEKEEEKSSPEDDAYAMGRQFGFAAVFAMLEKPANVDKNMRNVTEKAKALVVDVPEAPPKDGAMDTMRASTIPDAIEKKHDAKIAAAYRLGVTMTDVFFGVSLEADVSSQVAELATHAKTAGVPGSVYEAKLDALKASPSEGTVGALSKSLDGHFGYQG